MAEAGLFGAVAGARHPARSFAYDELVDRLEDARRQRLLVERRSEDGLSLYIYSDRCVYDRAWDAITTIARGLVLHHASRRVVATPFPKFFNLGERDEPLPDLPFEVAEKLDGSLIIVFQHQGRWRAVTKGDFDSAQARWAQARLEQCDLSALDPGTIYLAEAIYPANRIIVRYTDSAMVLLGAYAEGGTELDRPSLAALSERLGWRLPAHHAFGSISDLLLHAQALPRDREGFVLRFADGTRLKIKGDEYRRLHALVSRVTPLALWEAMTRAEDLETIRRDLPEEFWSDFDGIVASLDGEQSALLTRIAALAASVADLSDKELGLHLPSLPPELSGFLFTYRKSGGRLTATERGRQSVLRAIRPTGNILAGYHPSYAMNRIIDETG